MPHVPGQAAARAADALLRVDGVSIAYHRDRRAAVRDASLSLQRGEIGCLLGPSGCGKSTLMRGIAGFEKPLVGSVTLDGRVLSTPASVVAPEHRGIGMMFQDFALFPHLDVARNVAFGLRHLNAAAQSRRVGELLELVGLSGFERRYPHSLSGGEQQRVALVRAMAPKPVLLLLDEAFSSLDVELRQTLAPEIRDILLSEGMSAMLVTHDQGEAFAFADRVGVMHEGSIHQWDEAYNLYHRPLTRFVADFIGEGEFIDAVVLDSERVATSLGVRRAGNGHAFKRGRRVKLLVRPDDVLHDDDSRLTGEVLYKSFRGSHFLYRVRLPDGQRVLCFADSHHNHALGEHIGLRPNLEHLVMFERDDGEQ